mgnify:CR=1 FL=1
MDEPQLSPENPGPAPAADEGATGTALTVAIAVALTGAVAVALILQTPPALCPNDNSRWNAIWAMVETGRCSWLGAEQPWWTIDRCTFDPVRTDTLANTKEDAAKARWYSSKPQFMEVLLAGIALPVCRIGGLDFKRDIAYVGRAILILVNVVPLLLLLVFFGRLMIRMGIRGFSFAYCMIAAAAGTYLTAWCVTLNNHLPAAFCVFFALYAVVSISRDPGAGRGWYVMAGLFSGLAGTFENQAWAILGLIGAWLLLRCLRRSTTPGTSPGSLAVFAVAAVVPVGAYFVTEYLCTGRWLPFQWTFPQHYDPYWMKPAGIDALHESRRVYLFHLMLGHHGLFSLTPIFLISVIGLLRCLHDRQGTMRPLALVILVAAHVVIAFEVKKTSNYGGTCQGARWLFWLIPMWLLMLPAGIEWLGRRRAGRGLAVLLLALSVFSVAYAVRMPWSRSWLHELLYLRGMISY